MEEISREIIHDSLILQSIKGVAGFKLTRSRFEHSNNSKLDHKRTQKQAIMNPHLETLPSDYLYHIGFDKKEAKEKFGDVKASDPLYSLYYFYSYFSSLLLWVVVQRGCLILLE